MIPTALILGAVAALGFSAFQRVTNDLILERNLSRTQLLASQLGAELAGYTQRLGAFAAELSPLGDDVVLQQARLEASWTPGQLQAFDAGLLLLDEGGRVVAAAPLRQELLGQDWSDVSSDTDSEVHFSNILIDRLAGTDVIAVTAPLPEDRSPADAPVSDAPVDTLVGLFHVERMSTRSSSFYQDIWRLYIGRREIAYLVDQSGRAVFHPDTFFIGERLALEAVDRALTDDVGALRTRNADGEAVVASYAPVPGTPWELVAEENWAALTRPSRLYSRLMLLLLGLGVLVPVTMVGLGVRRITQPIAGFIDAAQEIADGRFRAIEVHTGDELETLAEQFSQMATELEAWRANLEQRVADRTRELATVNAVSAAVSGSLALDEVLQAALDETLAATGMEAGAAFRLQQGPGPLSAAGEARTELPSTAGRQHDLLILQAQRGFSAPFVQQIMRLPLNDSAAAQAVGENMPVVRRVEDYAPGALRTLLEEEGLALVISVPLVSKGQPLGALNLATRTPRMVDAETISLLAAVGQQVGVAVENARLYAQAREHAAAMERSRLAHELHDAVSQTLFSASLIADVLPRLWARDPAEGEKRLEMLRTLTRGALAEMRTLLLELRPAALMATDMPDLIRQLGQAAAGRTRLQVDVDVAPVEPLPPEVKLALYRIAQEALNNTIKHAEADRVTMMLHALEPGAVELVVTDNGRGFDPGAVPAGRLGLGGMAERAATIGAALEVSSAPGRGTQVRVVWKQTEDEHGE